MITPFKDRWILFPLLIIRKSTIFNNFNNTEICNKCLVNTIPCIHYKYVIDHFNLPTFYSSLSKWVIPKVTIPRTCLAIILSWRWSSTVKHCFELLCTFVHFIFHFWTESNTIMNLVKVHQHWLKQNFAHHLKNKVHI